MPPAAPHPVEIDRPHAVAAQRVTVLMYHRVGTAHNAWESRYAIAAEHRGSRQRLAELLRHDVCYLTDPFGHADDRVEAATRAAGYRTACSTSPGFSRCDGNRLRIRRIDVYGTDTPHMLLCKRRLGSNDGTQGHTADNYMSRLMGPL